MLLLASALLIGFAAYAFARTPPHEQRGHAWPAPAQTAAVVLALPVALVLAYVAPWLIALAILAAAGGWALRGRPGRLRARPPRRRRA